VDEAVISGVDRNVAYASTLLKENEVANSQSAG
jgi:hypothetical protein